MAFWGSVHPMDLIKSKIQTDNLKAPKYAGIADAFRQTVAERGFRGLYRGVGPSLLRAFVGNACQFTVYEQVMKALQ